MSYIVTSDRLRWKRGERLDASALEGSNIAALLEAGHLEAAPKKINSPAKPDAPTAPSEEE